MARDSKRSMDRRDFLHASSAGTVAGVALPAMLQVSAAAADRAAAPKLGERRLFLDDHEIANIDNLQRTMHQPAKRGAVVRSATLGQTIQTRTAPVWDSRRKTYKLWVLGTDQNVRVSADGLHWTAGPKSNLQVDMAILDPLDDPERRYKAALLNQGFAVSPDGVVWKRLNVPAIPSSDEGNFSYQPSHGLFIHTVKRSGPHGRAVAIATSRDFKTWTDHGVVFHADKRDQELGRENIKLRQADRTLRQMTYHDPTVHNVDVYNMGVFRYEGLYIGMPAMYHASGRIPNYPNTDGFHLVQLCCSRDLKNWQRLGDRRPFLGPSRLDAGAYDLTQILPPSAPVLRDNDLWFYYTGLKYRAAWTYVGKYPKGKEVPIPGLDPDRGAVCLAVLRRDGFVSLNAGGKPGTVTSRPLALPGSRLFVNFEALRGEMRLEVLGEDGKVVALSRPITGDHRASEVSWERGRLARGQVVTLRFTLRAAHFFSYWFEA